MTVTIATNSLQGGFDPNVIDGGGASILKLAQAGDPEAQARLAGKRTFQVRASTTTNDAVTLANAVVNLTAQGVLFPADSVRKIQVRAWTRRVTSGPVGYTEGNFFVTGHATTPVVPTIPTAATAAATIGPHEDGRIGLFLPYNAAAGTPKFGLAQVGISTTDLSSPASNFQIYVAPLGPSAGIALRWYIEVDVGPLVILPVAT